MELEDGQLYIIRSLRVNTSQKQEENVPSQIYANWPYCTAARLVIGMCRLYEEVT
jgi:hypothetical protein